MKHSTLQQIKKELSKLSSVYSTLVEEWNGKLAHGNSATYPVTIIVNVILSKMAFNPSNCDGYSHDAEEKKLYSHLKTLISLNKYNDECYMTHFPTREATFIIDGNVMSEEYEEYDKW